MCDGIISLLWGTLHQDCAKCPYNSNGAPFCWMGPWDARAYNKGKESCINTIELKRDHGGGGGGDRGC